MIVEKRLCECPACPTVCMPCRREVVCIKHPVNQMKLGKAPWSSGEHCELTTRAMVLGRGFESQLHLTLDGNDGPLEKLTKIIKTVKWDMSHRKNVYQGNPNLCGVFCIKTLSSTFSTSILTSASVPSTGLIEETVCDKN
jgi:hypothetical protein